MSRETEMMGTAKALVLWAPAAAAGLAAGWASGWDWVVIVAAVTAAVIAAAAGMALAEGVATERFLAEGAVASSDAEQALASRVGLDPVTVIEAKAAVKAAVRAVMVRRAAGLAALCAGPRGSAIAARARVLEAQALAAAESSAPGTATGSGSSAAPGAESPSAVVLGLAELSAAAAERAAVVASKDRRDDVE
jgi:hypothetical protein